MADGMRNDYPAIAVSRPRNRLWRGGGLRSPEPMHARPDDRPKSFPWHWACDPAAMLVGSPDQLSETYLFDGATIREIPAGLPMPRDCRWHI